MARSLALLIIATACRSHPHSSPAPNAKIEEAWLDRSIDPCTDFYKFACGGWQRNVKLPEGAQEVLSLQPVFDQNTARVKAIIDDAVAGKIDDPIGQKISAFYKACMATDAGAEAELQRELAAIDSIRVATDLARAVARIHLLQGGIRRWWTGTGALFSFSTDYDLVDGTLVVGELDQGGLGLPAASFYLGPESAPLRAEYVTHVEAMLGGDATPVLLLEGSLARLWVAETARRDPAQAQHRVTRAELARLVPSFAWDAYFTALGRADISELNMMVPSYYEALEKLLSSTPPDHFRTYLRWQLLNAVGFALPARLAKQHAKLAALVGASAPPREQYCVEQVDEALGPAIGGLYLARHYSSDIDAVARDVVARVLAAFGKRIDQVDWLDAPTKREAHAKLSQVGAKIGGPPRSRPYDKLTIGTSHLGNVLRAREHDAKHWITRVGTHPTRDEWLMAPQTMNAYFDSAHSELVLPAAIFIPPMFYARGYLANTYANIGWVAGHEVTHGFDSEGRKYDARGALRAWWSPATNAEFERRAACVGRFYSGFEVLPELFVNGEQTMTENIADLAAIRTAFDAYGTVRDAASKVAGFDADQQFFVAYAQSTCAASTPEYLRSQVATDSHAPWRIRVNAPLAATPEFARVFRCSAGSKMAPRDACTIW